MKPATIYDVARHAGVSHQTVSRFLSGFAGIRPETRARVETALAELEYRPNAAARTLRSRRVDRIGVLADRVDQTGPARIIAGATAAARERGYLLDVVLTDGLEQDAIDAALAVIDEHRVAGVLATAQTDLMVEHLRHRSRSLPMVVDARIPAFPGGPTVSEHAGHLAARHLLDLGHRRIGYVSGPTAWLAASDRLRGFKAEVEGDGGELMWTREGDWSAARGAAAWRGLDAEERRVTAVGCGNDSTAIGLISAAVESGLRVPDDLSVIGNDDLEEARYLQPALSTINVDFEGEGRALIDALLEQVDPAPEPAVALRPPMLMARGSTRALG